MSKDDEKELMTLIAGIAWGLSRPRSQYLTAHGLQLIYSLIRLVFSGSCFTASCYLADQEKVQRHAHNRPLVIHPTCFLFAFLGLLATQLTYLEAIDAIAATAFSISLSHWSFGLFLC